MNRRDLTILLTNNEGIYSPGLWAAAEELATIGTLWIAAPDENLSKKQRYHGSGSKEIIQPWNRKTGNFKAFAVSGSPSACIHHGLLEMLPCIPDLVVSGINSGSGIGMDIAWSGIIGAALEAANYGIPTLSVSQETITGGPCESDGEMGFSAAAWFCRLFTIAMAEGSLDEEINVLKIEIPENASRTTLWEVTSLSKKSLRLIKKVDCSEMQATGNNPKGRETDLSKFREGTDAHTVFIKEHVAVTPLSLDMTSRVDLKEFYNNMKKRTSSE